MLAQDKYRESYLEGFEVRSFYGASVTRESDVIGEKDVGYVIMFDTPNTIRGDSYALVHIPKSDAFVRENRLRCKELSQRSDKDCSLVSEDEEYSVIKIEGLCLEQRD